MDKGIWVTGSGTAVGPRDECVLTVGAEVRAATAADALDGCAQALDRMRDVLLGAGVPAAALATAAVSLTPVHDPYPTVAGFQAAVQLTARTGDLEAVGTLLGAVVAAGGEAARVHDVAYRHSDPSGLVAMARQAAWADAQARATQLAELAGRALGEVLSIDETVARPRPPGPMRMAAMAEAAPAAGMTLDAGEGSVVVSLTVGWALR
jgi:hypothetical protein